MFKKYWRKKEKNEIHLETQIYTIVSSFVEMQWTDSPA